MSSPIAIVQNLITEYGEKTVRDGESECATDFGADDSEDDRISRSSSSSSFRKNRVVRFADEYANGALQEVVEIEDFKAYCKFSKDDREQAEHEWCEELLEQLGIEEGGVARLLGYVVELAVSVDGYEVVQEAFETAHGKEKALLLSELQGNVHILATSPYGAEVLQTCLELLRPAEVSFIADELAGDAAAVARSQSGHAVLCRMFEYLPPKFTAPLVEQLLMSVRELCCHPCGSLVMSHLIDYSTHEDQRRTCEAVSSIAALLFRHRNAAPLLKKAQIYLRKTR